MDTKSNEATENPTATFSTPDINIDNDNMTEMKSGTVSTIFNKPLNDIVKRRNAKCRPSNTSERRKETAGIGLELHIFSFLLYTQEWALGLDILGSIFF